MIFFTALLTMSAANYMSRGSKGATIVWHNQEGLTINNEVSNFSTFRDRGIFASPEGQTHLILGNKILCWLGDSFGGLGGFGHLRGRGNGLGGGEMIVADGF